MQVDAIRTRFEVNIKDLYILHSKSSKHGELGLSRFWGHLNYNEYHSTKISMDMGIFFFLRGHLNTEVPPLGISPFTTIGERCMALFWVFWNQPGFSSCPWHNLLVVCAGCSAPYASSVQEVHTRWFFVLHVSAAVPCTPFSELKRPHFKHDVQYLEMD